MRNSFQSRSLASTFAAVCAVALSADQAWSQQALPPPPIVNLRSGPAPTLTAVEPGSSVPITATPPDTWASQPRPSLIINPTWARRPYIEFPEAALANKIGNGRVTLRCTVEPTGALTDCSAIEELPQGQGFAQSALTGARDARISPRLVDGAAIRASVQFTINYNMPMDDLAVPLPSPKR